MRHGRRTFIQGALLTFLAMNAGARDLSAHARFSAGKQLKPRDNNDGLKTRPLRWCGAAV